MKEKGMFEKLENAIVTATAGISGAASGGLLEYGIAYPILQNYPTPVVAIILIPGIAVGAYVGYRLFSD